MEGLPEHRKVPIPLRPAEKENMVSVNLSYLARHLLVDRFKQGIQRCQLRKLRDWLIQQVITEHRRLIAILRRHPPPEGHQVLLLPGTLVHPPLTPPPLPAPARLPARLRIPIT